MREPIGGAVANAESAGRQASAWVCRFAPLIRAGGRVLDLACGGGRHTLYLAALGHAVVAVDSDGSVLESLLRESASLRDRIETLQCDLESAAWPFAPVAFDAVVVTNYLHRPLFGSILASLRPGGVLIYETFALGQERFGRPRNPDFLLRPGELLQIIGDGWRVVAFEQGLEGGTEPNVEPVVRQRICAVQTSAWPVLLARNGVDA